MAEAAPEPRDWATEITQWLQATGKTQTCYKQVLADALRLEEGERVAPSPGQVGKALRGHKRQDKLSCSVNERHTAWVNNEFPP